jgi:hypothetical protein
LTRRESPMVAKFREVEETAANEPLVLERSSREAPMITEYADYRMLQRPDPSDRRLRNRLIVANVVAWVAIIVLIRLIFF